VHEHVIGGGSSMVALARKDRHVRRRPVPDLRILDPALLRSTDADREAYAPLREILEEAAQDLRHPA